MSEIKRYNLRNYGGSSEIPSGVYITFADHQADKQEAVTEKDQQIALREQDIQSLRASLSQAESNRVLAHTDAKEARKQIAALQEKLHKQSDERLAFAALHGFDLRELNDKLKSQEEQIAKMQQWINDLQSGMYINCVYCGHRYGPKESTPVSMADILKAHIEQCPKHPLSAAKAELASKDQQIAALTAERDKLQERVVKLEEACRALLRRLAVIPFFPEDRRAWDLAYEVLGPQPPAEPEKEGKVTP